MPVKAIDIEAIELKRGSHTRRSDGLCVMEAQFWGRVQKTDDCWLWLGATNEDGYGTLGHSKAHRVAWELTFGPIPAGMVVCHQCDNPPCVRPDHLFLGTVADNNRDRHAKGRSRNLFPPGEAHPARQRAGERHWCARLSDADVAAIREAREHGVTTTALAARFGVHAATISRVARGVWR